MVDEQTAMARDAFRRFAEDIVAPLAEEIHRKDLTVPESLLGPMRDMGVFGLSIPEQFGGFAPAEGENTPMMIAVTEALAEASLAAAGSLITRPPPGPSAGVLLTNIGVPWLSHANLSDRRADMISCTIEGNPDGTTAVDYTVNCATGYPAATGEGSLDRPVNHVLPAWDIACAYQAALAIMAAVERRGRTGQGAELRLSLADVAFTMLSHLGVSAEAELLGTDRPAIGNHIYGAFGRDFGTKDGRRIMVAGISAGQWKALVKACALNDGIAQIEYSRGCNMAHEADRYNAREEIAALIEPWVAARSFDQVKSLFDAAHVCWGAYDSPTELMNSDPRVALSNPIWGEVQTSGVGRHRAAGATVRLAGEERSAPVPAPLLGEHTDAVLADVLGLGSGAIGRLHDNGVVAGPDRDPTVSMA
eukprot:TRINITY_DN8830_c0_g1_i5.p1 TRINITY_DN8830_c0_g1~~TRINITY_DN8830_c0_g1_i5.p1  ORF type:complete len:451 (+),score=81.60 TRINITY_DN8830_c0_g1_i5:99-1355(+)